MPEAYVWPRVVQLWGQGPSPLNRPGNTGRSGGWLRRPSPEPRRVDDIPVRTRRRHVADRFEQQI